MLMHYKFSALIVNFGIQPKSMSLQQKKASYLF